MTRIFFNNALSCLGLNLIYGEKQMDTFRKAAITVTLTLFSITAMASPKWLIIRNNTNVQSNAYVGGKIASKHPTQPRSVGQVSWNEVRLACFVEFPLSNQCSALVKMATDTPNPVNLGVVTMDVHTGIINPKHLSANGYTLQVSNDGPADVTLSKD